MALSGDFSTLKLADLLQVLKMHSKSGVLKVQPEPPGAAGFIVLRRGDILRARGGANYQNIGQILFSMGVVDEEHVRKAAEIQRHLSRPRPLGAVLVEVAAVTRDHVREAMAKQIEHAVYEMLGWDIGQFHFEDGDPAAVDDIAMAPRRVADLRVNTQHVVLEAVRRRDEENEVVVDAVESALGGGQKDEPLSRRKDDPFADLFRD